MKLASITAFIHPAALAAIVVAVTGISASAAGAQPDANPIDRHALVTRHNIECNVLATPLPLGNGEFSFTADATGLQTFAGNAMSHWCWHSFPGKDDLRPLNLGRLRLCHGDGSAVTKKEITAVKRTLDLWSGTQTTHFEIAAGTAYPRSAVRVETCVDPKHDAVAVRIESPLLASGDLLVTLDFPYAWTKEEPSLGDWSKPELHTTKLTRRGGAPGTPGRGADFARKVDDASYHVRLAWSAGAELAAAAGTPHAFELSSAGTNRLEFVCAFAAAPAGTAYSSAPEFADVGKVFDESSRAWKTFWSTGGAIDLSGSKDPRWRELERRVVLSQYLTATQSSGSWPPAETGLFGSAMWGSRFHMEMVWWHLAHFALWDRWDRAADALGCYQRFLPGARALAAEGGHKGLEWPKCVGPDGISSPWRGNRVLLWKEPHPIFFAELDYRRSPTRATLDKWRDVVFGTAEFMADYAKRDAKTGLYSLAPAMPPSEQGITRDTVFDLAYWRWGLDAAQRWRERLGLAREPRWDEVRKRLAPLPVVDGLFVHSAEWHDTYTKRAYEHPDPVGVLGMLPPIEGVDAATAHRTVLKVWETWNWDRCWGWDFPWMAMAAARVGEPRLAVDALLKNSPKNSYDVRGLNGGWYLPGNGGLLYAVAMMAAGWDGAPDRNAPGFPDDGSWVVKWEGLKKAP
jgi:hypothetical protein